MELISRCSAQGTENRQGELSDWSVLRRVENIHRFWRFWEEMLKEKTLPLTFTSNSSKMSVSPWSAECRKDNSEKYIHLGEQRLVIKKILWKSEKAKSTQGTFLPSCLLKRKWSFKASPLLLIKSSRYKLKTFNPHTFHCVGSFQFDLDTTKLNFVPVRLIFEVSIPRFRLWQFCFQKLQSKQSTSMH